MRRRGGFVSVQRPGSANTRNSRWYVGMDYDDKSLEYVKKDIYLLMCRFNNVGGHPTIAGADIYESSKDHYHVRLRPQMPWDAAFEIIMHSHCSEEYIRFVEDYKEFTLRVGIKELSGKRKNKPSPRLLESCTQQSLNRDYIRLPAYK